jgi:hypothetical protein
VSGIRFVPNVAPRSCLTLSPQEVNAAVAVAVLHTVIIAGAWMQELFSFAPAPCLRAPYRCHSSGVHGRRAACRCSFHGAGVFGADCVCVCVCVLAPPPLLYAAGVSATVATAAAPTTSGPEPAGGPLSVDTAAPRRSSRIVPPGSGLEDATSAVSDTEFLRKLAVGLGCAAAVPVALAASELLQTASPRDLLSGPMTLRCVTIGAPDQSRACQPRLALPTACRGCVLWWWLAVTPCTWYPLAGGCLAHFPHSLTDFL